MLYSMTYIMYTTLAMYSVVSRVSEPACFGAAPAPAQDPVLAQAPENIDFWHIF